MNILIIVAVLMIAFAPTVSAETVGDLQKEESGIIVDYEYSQASELIDLGNRMVSKRDEIREFEDRILPSIQWNIPPDIITLSVNGKLEGNFFLASGNINGEFNAEDSAKSEALYKDFDPYVSAKTTKELLFFARNLLEENGRYSPAEQALQIQLIDLENKGINETEKMHIFYIQKIYNSVVDIGNELDSSIKSINDKIQTEQQNEDTQNQKDVIFFLLVGVFVYGTLCYGDKDW